MSGRQGKKSNYSTSASIASSVKTLRFGATDVRTSAVSNEGEEEDVEQKKEKLPEKRSKQEIDAMSWNERMRHQSLPMVKEVSVALDPVICTLFVVTLTGCVDALAILRETCGVPYLDVDLEYISATEKYADKYSDWDRMMQNDPETLARSKFRKDVCWIEKTLKTTLEDMRRSWLFESLLKVLNDYKLMREDEDTLLMSKKFNQNELLKLRACEEAERENLLRGIQLLTEELGNRKDELNDGIVEYVIKTRFLRQWEDSRYEQNKMILTSKENGFLETTKTMTIQIDRENRVHEEMEIYIEESLQDYQKEIDKWMEKYDNDLEDYEIKIGKLRMDVEKKKDDYADLLDLYHEHKEMMEEYKQEKLRKQQEAEEEERLNRAATKIQSWWRGVMFRKGLGPFRKKKGKGKKGGNGKNSGKKNKK